MDISSDGNHIAAGKDGHVVMLDSDGELVWENSEVPAMGEILVSPNGSLTIVKGPMNNEGYILGNQGKIIKQVSLSGINPDISISNNGKYVVFAAKISGSFEEISQKIAISYSHPPSIGSGCLVLGLGLWRISGQLG